MLSLGATLFRGLDVVGNLAKVTLEGLGAEGPT
jgi:hypothetical protein